MGDEGFLFQVMRKEIFLYVRRISKCKFGIYSRLVCDRKKVKMVLGNVRKRRKHLFLKMSAKRRNLYGDVRSTAPSRFSLALRNNERATRRSVNLLEIRE